MSVREIGYMRQTVFAVVEYTVEDIDSQTELETKECT